MLALAFTPALTPLLIVSRRKAWRGVIGLRRPPVLGLGFLVGRGLGAVLAVAGGAGPAAEVSHLDLLGWAPQHPGWRRPYIGPARIGALDPGRPCSTLGRDSVATRLGRLRRVH